MASETFLKISKEKQNKLLQAAFNEFSRVPFEEASINKIITEAGISRGSFYMYFNDKQDLYLYLIKKDKKELEEKMFYLLEKHEGDFILAWQKMYDHIINHSTNEKNHNFYKQLFLGMKISFERHIIPTLEEIKTYKKEVLKRINKKLFNIKKSNDLFDAFLFIQMITLTSIGCYFINGCKRNNYQNRIKIIKEGIYERKEQ